MCTQNRIYTFILLKKYKKIKIRYKGKHSSPLMKNTHIQQQSNAMKNWKYEVNQGKDEKKL